MASTRITFALDDSLAATARRLGVDISAAARDGVATAVRVALAHADRAGYLEHPETPVEFWSDAEAWTRE